MPGVASALKDKLKIRNVNVFTGTGTITMSNEGIVVVNKASGAATAVSLTPYPEQGDVVIIKDGKGDAGTNYITITDPAAATIDGAANYVINTNYGSVLLEWNATQWNVIVDKKTAATIAQEALGTLTTVGAGTILAATIANRLLLRTGATAAFIDTTDTGTLLAAAIPGITVGQSFEFTYQNSTYSVATLTGGTGVNSAATFAKVGPGSWAKFLFTYASANTFNVVQVASGDNWIGLPSTSYSTGTTTTTFTAAEMTGGKLTIYTSTAATPGSIATATATAMFAAIQGAYVGLKWIFRVINDVATNSLTVTADGSVTLSGKTTYVATPYGSMDFEMTFTSATTATMKYIGGGQSTTV